MKGVLSEVVEIRDDFDGETYRAMDTASLGETSYVLHAFRKQSKRGIATPALELQLIRARLRAARQHERQDAKRRSKA
jgi:phage-related protein